MPRTELENSNYMMLFPNQRTFNLIMIDILGNLLSINKLPHNLTIKKESDHYLVRNS